MQLGLRPAEDLRPATGARECRRRPGWSARHTRSNRPRGRAPGASTSRFTGSLLSVPSVGGGSAATAAEPCDSAAPRAASADRPAAAAGASGTAGPEAVGGIAGSSPHASGPLGRVRGGNGRARYSAGGGWIDHCPCRDLRIARCDTETTDGLETGSNPAGGELRPIAGGLREQRGRNAPGSRRTTTRAHRLRSRPSVHGRRAAGVGIMGGGRPRTPRQLKAGGSGRLLAATEPGRSGSLPPPGRDGYLLPILEPKKILLHEDTGRSR